MRSSRSLIPHPDSSKGLCRVGPFIQLRRTALSQQLSNLAPEPHANKIKHSLLPYFCPFPSSLSSPRMASGVACLYTEIFKLHLTQTVSSRGTEVPLISFTLSVCGSLKTQNVYTMVYEVSESRSCSHRSSLLSAAKASKVNVQGNCSVFTTT